MELNNIYNINCLEGMKHIPDKSVDMILTDLPYGMTDCKWDNIIPFNDMWEQYNRIIKDNGAIVLFSAQPFTTKLIYSNLKHFRYCWYWVKPQVTGFALAKKQPLRVVEDICVFYKKQPCYNPQGLIKLKEAKEQTRKTKQTDKLYGAALEKSYVSRYTNYPKQTLFYSRQSKGRLHPTQKPLALCEYLIKTYTNAGDVVLDSCAGSGTTLLAAKNTGRQYIGFETDEKYYNTAFKRLNATERNKCC